MNIDFNVYNYEYNKKIRSLNIEAQGQTKSKKYFPVYLIDGKEYIFKPLSKTKPFTTPLFAYAEVFWSNVINKYFDVNAPIYNLAICNGYEENEKKYHNQGTIVESIIKKEEKLVNLLEYFKNNPDKNVDINNYINYCGVFYDYTDIFKSDIISNNEYLASSLANQVLISILRSDINYHYENVSFIYENNKLKRLAPPIDHEFSTYFLYPDNLTIHLLNYFSYLEVLQLKEIKDDSNNCWPETKGKINIIKNIDFICENYHNVVENFLINLDKLITDLQTNDLKFSNNEDYQYPFNTFDFEIGNARYKQNDEELAKKLEQELIRVKIDIQSLSKMITSEVLNVAIALRKTLNLKLNKNTNKLTLS